MSNPSSGNGAWLLGLVLLLAGCAEDVTAVLGTERSYTLWGVLNPLADTQYVRVFPIEGTLNPGTPGPLDVRFVSSDLDSGEERLWRDSVFVDERGVVGHVFRAPFRAAYGHTYRLEIADEEGGISSVDVEVPLRTNIILGEPDTTQGVLLRGHVPNRPPRLVRSELGFGIAYVTGVSASGCPIYNNVQYVLPYDDRIRRAEDGWSFLVNLEEVYGFVRSRVEEDPFYRRPFGITLGYLRFDTIVANEAWAPPDGVFDPNVLVQPGTMSNVENGFGFVGAGYRLSRSWTLLRRVVEKSGFRADYAEC